MSGTALDLRKRHFAYKRGELLAIGTWINLGDDGWRPCLALIRQGDEYDPDLLMPCIVTVDQAFIWYSKVGVGMPELAARQAASFCEALRYEVTPRNAIRIASFIEDLLGDLLNIPPYRPSGVVGADAILTDRNTGRSTEATILDDV